MTFAGRVPGYVMRREENSNRSSFCLGTYQFKLPSATSDANSAFGPRLTIESGLSRHSNFNSLGVRLDKIVGDPTTLADLQDVGKLQDSVVADHWLRSRLVDWADGTD